MSWTLTEIDKACNEARAIARGQGKPAQVIRNGAKLRAVARALVTDEIIVRDVEADFLSQGQIVAVREMMDECEPVREAFQRMRAMLDDRGDGKPWPEIDRRQLLDAVARSWNVLDRHAS